MHAAIFQVKYDVEFTKQEGSINRGNAGQSNGHFQFTVRRSKDTSDGAFMYDKSVVVQLVRNSDGKVMATHVLGGGVFSHVVYADGPVYQTKFSRADIAATAAGSYKVKVLFRDVDGNLVEQGASGDVTF